MNTRTRFSLVVGAALLLALGAAAFHASGAQALIVGSQDSEQPDTMEQFLTGVTQDVDAYWTKTFEDAGLPEPRVSYEWNPAGEGERVRRPRRKAWRRTRPRTTPSTSRSGSR